MHAADELRTLAIDLGKVAPETAPRMRQAIEVTARHTKDDAAENLSADVDRRLRHAPRAYDYDIRTTGGSGASILGYANGFEAEVGPNRARRQGPMAGWYEEGSVDGVPASMPLTRAMDANVGDFEYGMQRAIDDTLRGIGL